MAEGNLFNQVLEWLQQQKPVYLAMKAATIHATNYVGFMVQQNWPIICSWLIYFGRLSMMLSVLWLGCILRGLGSLLHLGSAAHFVLLWCTFLSMTAMTGLFYVLITLGIASVAVIFFGYTPAVLIVAIFGSMMLWLHGSFWITGALIITGGCLFSLNHARLAILVTTMYSIYCAKVRVGWLGLILCMSLAFVSNDILIHLLKGNVNEDGGKSFDEQAEQTKDTARNSCKESGHTGRNDEEPRFFSDKPSGVSSRTSKFVEIHAESATSGFPAGQTKDTVRNSCKESGHTGSNDEEPRFFSDKPSGESSQTSKLVEIHAESATSGFPDPSSVEEVKRIMHSSDHYAALGLPRLVDIDVTVLKREYRKKAMLVHPDKNMGNALAEDAFKKLQSAYEVLLDLAKKKIYDEELRREDLTRSFQSGAEKNGRYDSSQYGFTNSGDEGGNIPADSIRITCRKCNKSHIWLHTNRSKARARWCQDCQDYHQAREGDGWVEQSGHSLFFEMLQEVDVPCAYACVDGKIFDVSEWAICQVFNNGEDGGDGSIHCWRWFFGGAMVFRCTHRVGIPPGSCSLTQLSCCMLNAQGMDWPPNTHKPSFSVNGTIVGKSIVYEVTQTHKRSAHGCIVTNLDEYIAQEEIFVWLQNAMASDIFINDDDIFDNMRMKTGSRVKSYHKKKGRRQW